MHTLVSMCSLHVSMLYLEALINRKALIHNNKESEGTTLVSIPQDLALKNTIFTTL